MKNRQANGKTYDTATAFKIAEAARRHGEDFTAVLYRAPDGSFFVEEEMYNIGRDHETGLFKRMGGRFISPVTAEEALEWLGDRADKPIKIYPIEPPGPYEASFHTEILKWLRGKRNEIRPGTVGEGWAKIAKDLIAKNPGLLKSSYELRKAIGAELARRDRARNLSATRTPILGE